MKQVMIKSSFFVLLGLLGLNRSVFAQTDSLRALIPLQESSPELLVKTYNQLAWEYRDLRSDSALYFSNLALRLARDFGFHHEEVQALNYMGVSYRNLSVYSKAFEKYLEALKKAEEYDDYEQKGYALINLGNLYLFQSNYKGAIEYFVKALDQAQELGDQRMVAYCYINLRKFGY